LTKKQLAKRRKRLDPSKFKRRPKRNSS
jgi:hypothetical protein